MRGRKPSQIGAADVVARAGQSAFGKPLVMNVMRGHLVEALVSLALEPDWQWRFGDFSGWDFVNDRGTRLEVKQSASLQNWSEFGSASKPRFDIRARDGFWEDGLWVQGSGRPAHLYVFAHHPIFSDQADHRDPDQWNFYVVPTSALPEQKTISLGRVKRFAQCSAFCDLKEEVSRECERM